VLRHKAPAWHATAPMRPALGAIPAIRSEAVLREQFARRPTWNQPHVTSASVRRPASCCDPLNQSMRVPTCCDRPGLTLLTLPPSSTVKERLVL
jgi:hypothetical protein